MTLMQFNDALMTIIAVGVVTLSCMAIKYYKQAPLFDEYDIEKDITNDIVHQGKRLAKRDLKRTKKSPLWEASRVIKFCRKNFMP